MTKDRKPRPYDQIKQIFYSNIPTAERYTDAFVNEDDYIQTDVWKRIREKRLRIDNYKCQSCGSPCNLAVHHIRYPAVWGEEQMENLVTLCDACHKKTHNR